MGFVYNKVDSVDYSDLGVTLSDPATQLRSGVKALNSSGVLVTGAMPEHGSGSDLIIHPNTLDYSQDMIVNIPSGYYDGNAKATAEYNTVYTQGLNIGLSQNAYNEGVTLTDPQMLSARAYARDATGTLVHGTRRSDWDDIWISVEHPLGAQTHKLAFDKNLYTNFMPFFRVGVGYYDGSSFEPSDKRVYYTFIGPSTPGDTITIKVVDSLLACYRQVQFTLVEYTDTKARCTFTNSEATVINSSYASTKNNYARIESLAKLFS